MTTKLKGTLSPWLKKKRLSNVSKHIGDNLRVLDLGCDDADLLSYIAPKHYTGIDNNKDLIEFNKTKYHDSQWVNFITTNLDEKFELMRTYDVVVMSAIIEHLSNFKALLADISNITENKSRIIITTPVKKSDFLLKIGAKLGVFAKESLEEHQKYYSKNDFLNLDGWNMTTYDTFEFGLNQIIVLEKIQ